jgi:hypothetical protein
MYTEIEQKLRENDGTKIIKQWTCSPVKYEGDSSRRVDNPDYHPPIHLTEKGTFVDVSGRPIPKAKVPAYILEEAKQKLKHTPTPPRQEVKLSDAMLQAANAADRADTSVKTPRRGRAKTK